MTVTIDGSTGVFTPGATLGSTVLLSAGAGTITFPAATGTLMLSANTYSWPASYGTNGQVLTTNGAGVLTWSNAGSGSGTVNTGAINQLAYYAAAGTALSGLATANGGLLNTSSTGVPSITATPTLGVAGATAGSLTMAGSTSGTTTIQPSAVAGTTTATVPARTGNLMMDGPAFSVYTTVATNTSHATWTKVILNTLEYDTNSNFSTVNSRFTPTVAGYYQLNGGLNTNSNYAYSQTGIYKNGALYKAGANFGNTNAVAGTTVGVSTLVYLNGTTDYVELWWIQGSGSTVNSGLGQTYTYLNGSMVRGG